MYDVYGNLPGCSICTSTEEATPLGGQWTMIYQTMLQHVFVGKGVYGCGIVCVQLNFTNHKTPLITSRWSGTVVWKTWQLQGQPYRPKASKALGQVSALCSSAFEEPMKVQIRDASTGSLLTCFSPNAILQFHIIPRHGISEMPSRCQVLETVAKAGVRSMFPVLTYWYQYGLGRLEFSRQERMWGYHPGRSCAWQEKPRVSLRCWDPLHSCGNWKTLMDVHGKHFICVGRSRYIKAF